MSIWNWLYLNTWFEQRKVQCLRKPILTDFAEAWHSTSLQRYWKQGLKLEWNHPVTQVLCIGQCGYIPVVWFWAGYISVIPNTMTSSSLYVLLNCGWIVSKIIPQPRILKLIYVYILVQHVDCQQTKKQHHYWSWHLYDSTVESRTGHVPRGIHRWHQLSFVTTLLMWHVLVQWHNCRLYGVLVNVCMGGCFHQVCVDEMCWGWRCVNAPVVVECNVYVIQAGVALCV